MANGDAGDIYARFGLSHRVRKFAEKVIARGFSRGDKIKIGRIKTLFGQKNYRRLGFDSSSPLYLTDSTILKYLHHPKAKKNATVSVSLLPVVVRALNNPRHIYLDTSKKNQTRRNLIYVSSLRHPAYKNKVIKAVVHANYTKNGEAFHNVKSFGIVNKDDMKGKQYRKIK